MEGGRGGGREGGRREVGRERKREAEGGRQGQMVSTNDLRMGHGLVVWNWTSTVRE